MQQASSDTGAAPLAPTPNPGQIGPETPVGPGTGTEPDAVPETPTHGTDTRLEESQAELEAEEDPRIPNGSTAVDYDAGGTGAAPHRAA